MVSLEVEKLTKHFGGLKAVSDFSLRVQEGDIVGLIGPNGAGKSTIFNLISGFLKPTKGRVIFRGKNITGLPPHRIAEWGLARVFQGNVLFRNLTVLKNVLIASHLHNKVGYCASFWGTHSAHAREKELIEKVMDLLDFVGLGQQAYKLAFNLPHGFQRRMGVAIALAVEPKLLALDEPVTGMNAGEVSAMESMIKKLRDERGLTIVIVEHNMRTVMRLCDRIAVLSYGRKIAEGSPKEIVENPAVIEAYLGEENGAP